MQLIICEKPKVAQKVAAALSGGKFEQKRHAGVSYFLLNRNGKEIAIAPAVGHVYSLMQESKGHGYPVFDIKWVPAYEVDKGADYTKGYVESIEALARKADEFVCACDYDIEGSLIGFNVIRFACKSEKGKRMKFSALTEEDLIDAYEGMGELDYLNAYAGEARHMLDWFYGINLSRALMEAIRKSGKYQVMSIGRVQGPSLHILASREKEIVAFKPIPYWQLFALCKAVKFTHVKERFLKKEEASAALKASTNEGIVESVEAREYAQNPLPPFDLTDLQVEAYKQFSFAPAQTLQMAQTLYESSLISYPRTASQKLPEKLNLAKIINAIAKQGEYAKSAGELIAKKRFKPFEGKKEDPAHPAIHPTGQAGQMGEKEKKLYDLIVRRFLSCFAEAAKRESMKVVLDCNAQRYSVTGNRTVEQGWFAHYAPYVKLEETTLPSFVKGEKVHVDEFKMEEKKTQPPKRYTPASLISELEDRELGTKATRAVIVDTLFKRGYLSGSKSIGVTPFGMAVHDTLAKNAPEILDEELTRNIEKEMELITEGRVQKETAVEDGKKILIKILEEFREKEKEIGLELAMGLRQKEVGGSLLGKCNKCKDGELRIIRSKAGNQFVGCSNYPTCTNTYSLPREAKIEALGRMCEKCGTPMVKVIRRAQRPFEMCLSMSCETKNDTGGGMFKSRTVVIEAGATPPAQKTAIDAPKAKTTVVQKPAQTPAQPKTTVMVQKPVSAQPSVQPKTIVIQKPQVAAQPQEEFKAIEEIKKKATRVKKPVKLGKAGAALAKKGKK
ncbi:Reverse gyrase [Candidatus Anstonella stagnisolia]|nr:Reverse gyrase [Candidatus Anstonella stagnisolia]